MTGILVSLLLLAVTASAAGSSVSPPQAPPEKEREVRQIAIDEARANKIYRVRTAPGYPAVVEFPEAFAAPPACGDCGDKGLFRLDVFGEQRYLTVKPRLFPGTQPDGTVVSADEFITTLNVRLEHVTLTLQVELSDRDKADARVVFTLPGRAAESAYVRDEIAKARKAMEAEFVARIEAGVTENFLRTLVEPHRCVSSSARARKDDLVLEVTDLCQYGRKVFIRFTVENRGHLPAQIGEVVARKSPGKQASPVDSLKQYLAAREIPFQKSAVGVIGFRLLEGEEPAHSYELAVIEEGGRNRQVIAADIAF